MRRQGKSEVKRKKEEGRRVARGGLGSSKEEVGSLSVLLQENARLPAGPVLIRGSTRRLVRNASYEVYYDLWWIRDDSPIDSLTAAYWRGVVFAAALCRMCGRFRQFV